MKKIILTAAVALFTISAASAQFSYGVKAGANFASISNAKEIMDDTKMKTSIYLGAFGEYQISDFFGVAAELVYSRQGVAASGTEEGEDWKTRLRLNYVNIPILAKLYLIDGLSLDLGPQFGILAGAKWWDKYGDETDTEDAKEGFKSFDVSVGMGLTYNINSFLIQARYNLGLTDTADYGDLPDNEKPDDKFKNNVFQLGVGYRF